VEHKNGNTYEDIVDYVDATLTESDSVGYYYSDIAKGLLIPQGETIKLIGASDRKVSSGERLAEILNDDSLNIEIEYESIYGERWIITDDINYPQKK